MGRKLADDAFAAALLHIAKHRGFKSNKKTDEGKNAPDDSKKMLGAIEANRALLSQYGTVGRMVAKNAKFAAHKRNKGGDYSHTFERGDLRYEAEELFRAQRKLGNKKATDDLEARYTDIAFFQRPLQDSEHLVAMCPFELAGLVIQLIGFRFRRGHRIARRRGGPARAGRRHDRVCG